MTKSAKITDFSIDAIMGRGMGPIPAAATTATLHPAFNMMTTDAINLLAANHHYTHQQQQQHAMQWSPTYLQPVAPSSHQTSANSSPSPILMSPSLIPMMMMDHQHQQHFHYQHHQDQYHHPIIDPVAMDLTCKSQQQRLYIKPEPVTADSLSPTVATDANQQQQSKSRPKKYRCPYCWVAVSNTGQFRGHIRIHTGERPFKCDQPNCEKTFTRNEELTRHKRIHTGQRPYGCQLCNKRFGRKDHLKKHTKTHERHAVAAAVAAAAFEATSASFKQEQHAPNSPKQQQQQVTEAATDDACTTCEQSYRIVC